MESVNLAKAFLGITDYWAPKVVGRVNDQYVKAAKLKGNSPGTSTRTRTSCFTSSAGGW